jgi:hypothetical protein
MHIDQAQPSITSTVDGWKQHPEFSFIHLNHQTGQVLNTNTGNLIDITRRKGKRPSFTASVRCTHSKAVRHTRNLARAILLTFIGPPPTRGHEASHLNHDPSDCRLENLAWETRKANLSRRTAPPDGALHHHSKLGTEDAYSIYRQYHVEKVSMGKLAKKFMVSKPTVQQLVTGKTWMSYQAQFAKLVKQGVEVFPGAPEPTPEPVRVIAKAPTKAKPKLLLRPTKPDLQTLTEELREEREQSLIEPYDSELSQGLKEAQELAHELAEAEDDTPAPVQRSSSRIAWDKAEASRQQTSTPAPAPTGPRRSVRFPSIEDEAEAFLAPQPAPSPTQTPAPTRKSLRF